MHKQGYCSPPDNLLVLVTQAGWGQCKNNESADDWEIQPNKKQERALTPPRPFVWCTLLYGMKLCIGIFATSHKISHLNGTLDIPALKQLTLCDLSLLLHILAGCSRQLCILSAHNWDWLTMTNKQGLPHQQCSTTTPLENWDIVLNVIWCVHCAVYNHAWAVSRLEFFGGKIIQIFSSRKSPIVFINLG